MGESLYVPNSILFESIPFQTILITRAIVPRYEGSLHGVETQIISKTK